MTIYRISLSNGRFDHVASKRTAFDRAADMLGHEITPADIRSAPREWGVTIAACTRAEARATGFHA